MRRIYDAISQTLGYRTLQQFSGGDVWQLKVMLQALGFYQARTSRRSIARAAGANVFTPDVVAAVDAFRASEKLGGPAVGSPSGSSIRRPSRTSGPRSSAPERRAPFVSSCSTSRRFAGSPHRDRPHCTHRHSGPIRVC